MRYFNSILPTVILLLFLSACKSLEPKVSPSTNEHIQATLDGLVTQNEIPGLNFSYIDAKNRQYNYSSGFENKETQTELGPDHSLFSGSIGKTYAAAIIFQLIDEGKINLDQNIRSYLPSIDWLERIPNINDISVRMLLSHTSGLPRWVTKIEVWNMLQEDPDKVWSYKDRLSLIFDDEPVHKAGEGWAYSDTNYILLGLLIETLLEKDYYSILEERILHPNGLTNTYPLVHRKIERLACGYSQLPPSFHIPNQVVNDEGSYVFNPQVEWTGGGLASTTSDLVKWCHIYYNGSVIKDQLKPDMILIHENGRNAYETIHSYGMGTFIYDTKYGTAYGHSGFMPGYNSIMAYFPDLNISCALQTNCDYAGREMKLTEYLETCIKSIIRNE